MLIFIIRPCKNLIAKFDESVNGEIFPFPIYGMLHAFIKCLAIEFNSQNAA